MSTVNMPTGYKQSGPWSGGPNYTGTESWFSEKIPQKRTPYTPARKASATVGAQTDLPDPVYRWAEEAASSGREVSVDGGDLYIEGRRLIVPGIIPLLAPVAAAPQPSMATTRTYHPTHPAGQRTGLCWRTRQPTGYMNL